MEFKKRRFVKRYALLCMLGVALSTGQFEVIAQETVDVETKSLAQLY